MNHARTRDIARVFISCSKRQRSSGRERAHADCQPGELLLTEPHVSDAECSRWLGTPVPVEGQRLVWARPSELDSFPMPPADVPLLPTVRAAMIATARYALRDSVQVVVIMLAP